MKIESMRVFVIAILLLASLALRGQEEQHYTGVRFITNDSRP
jgi:hypothetical protein